MKTRVGNVRFSHDLKDVLLFMSKTMDKIRMFEDLDIDWDLEYYGWLEKLDSWHNLNQRDGLERMFLVELLKHLSVIVELSVKQIENPNKIKFIPYGLDSFNYSEYQIKNVKQLCFGK